MATPAPSVRPVMPATSWSPIPVALMIAPNAPPAPVIARIAPDCVVASVTTSLKDSLIYFLRAKNATRTPINNAIFLSPRNANTVYAMVPSSQIIEAIVPRRMMKIGRKIRKIPSPPDGRFLSEVISVSSSTSSNAFAKSLAYFSFFPRILP